MSNFRVIVQQNKNGQPTFSLEYEMEGKLVTNRSALTEEQLALFFEYMLTFWFQLQLEEIEKLLTKQT
jgi:hypothetical protein